MLGVIAQPMRPLYLVQTPLVAPGLNKCMIYNAYETVPRPNERNRVRWVGDKFFLGFTEVSVIRPATADKPRGYCWRSLEI